MSQFVLAIIYSLFAYGPMVICDVMTNKNEPSNTSSGGSSNKDRNAFFALRSCHQVLRGDSGEFFSPDYLCSNPPLWCNWTIQVSPGKRVHLQLEDFTPASTCHLKKDQIHLDESTGGGLGPMLGPTGDHRILEKCWKKAEYTSLSSTIHVVLLISRTPDPPLRGFYGRFRSLGGTEESLKNGADDTMNTSDSEVHEKREQSEVHRKHSKIELPRVPNPRSVSEKTSSPTEEPQVSYSSDQNHSPNTKTAGGGHFVSPAPTSMSNELPSGPENLEGEGLEKGSVTWQTVRGHLGEAPDGGGREGGGGGGGGEEEEEEEEEEEVKVSLKHSLTPDANSVLTGKKKIDRPHADSPSIVTESPLAVTTTTQGEVDTNIPKPKVEASKKAETEVDYKERTLSHQTHRNITHHPHLPGAFLFEVSVEVALSPQTGEGWDQRATTLLTTLKNMMKDELSSYAPKTISSKRIKRLSSGALFLLWLHFGEGQDGVQSHRVLHAAAQGLRGRSLLPQEGGTEGVVAYVSIADVNECGTQLSQCDAYAECVNRFGTYACRCRPGYLDKSRTSPGGTICIDPAASAVLPVAGCSWSSPAILRGIYCVCVLLCLLIVLLLFALAVMYRRRHQGAFLLRCQSHSNGSGLATVAGGDNNNNRNDHNSGSGGGCLKMSAVRNRPLPSVPPPPPTRRIKDGADGGGSLEPPLLKFGPLPHSDGSESLGSESRVKQ
ncbi:uncharacterized protein zgc:66455 isoform X1 [Alosa sapidissima]|uniref:uncharacterized protein zgc:66455 isoform X1 n=1 Tax=Alosa sapidissima TaxID=34773 RepID=UPI001C08E150|nr:uncharacterized protein zgc:66455 isoform X1 [Alosa sapidissima]